MQPHAADKGGKQVKKSHCAKAIQPAGKKTIYLKEAVLLLPGFRSHHIAKTRYHRVKDNVHEISHISGDVEIVVHDRRCVHIDEGGNDDLIRLQSRHIPDLMADERLCLSDYYLCLFCCQPFHILVSQIRIESVQIDRHENLLYQLHNGLCQQIKEKITGQKQHNDLCQRYCNFCQSSNVRLNIIFLLCIHQAVFISDKIADDRIEQKQIIVERQFLNCKGTRIFQNVF